MLKRGLLIFSKCLAFSFDSIILDTVLLGSIKSSTNAAGFTFCVPINTPEDLLYLSVQYCPAEVLHRIGPLHVPCFTRSFTDTQVRYGKGPVLKIEQNL